MAHRRRKKPDLHKPSEPTGRVVMVPVVFPRLDAGLLTLEKPLTVLAQDAAEYSGPVCTAAAPDGCAEWSAGSTRCRESCQAANSWRKR